MRKVESGLVLLTSMEEKEVDMVSKCDLVLILIPSKIMKKSKSFVHHNMDNICIHQNK
jgi:hypothetical protein